MASTTREERRFQGQGVSPGVARGMAYVHRPARDEVPRYPLPEDRTEEEIVRLERAIAQTRVQLTEIQERLTGAIGAKEAVIFDAHLLVLEDPLLLDEVVRAVRDERVNVEFAVHRTAHRLADELARIKDSYLSERAGDILDVARRLLQNLSGRAQPGLGLIHTEHILVAHHLTPSDTAQLPREFVRGFLTEAGSKNAHTAILARSLGLPAVSGLAGIDRAIETGTEILLDGWRGLVIVDPLPGTLQEYDEFERRRAQAEEDLNALRETASTTRDGRHLVLSANLDLCDDLPLIAMCGAEGVGLYRTEVFFFQHDALPDEEAQFENYARVAEAVKPHGVIIRTLDVGGDKPLDCLDQPAESNPFLGLRGIRLALERREMFRTQMRAILRASAVGEVRMMFPMISGVAELRHAMELLDECRGELRAEGRPYDEKMEVGIMIEVPAAALCAADLAREGIQFFSIGTNDLTQYTLAVDRLNEGVASLHDHAHPAVIRLIRMVADAGHAAGLWVGLCGEMASDLAMVPLLLGLGLDELSAASLMVPRIKRAVQSLDMAECRALAERALILPDPCSVTAACEELARARYGDLLG